MFLETQSWMKKPETDDDDQDTSLTEVKGAIAYIVTLFRQPLKARGVVVLTLQDEIEDAVDYAREYLGLESTNYRKVWHNLHVCPDCSHWPNVY